MTESKEVNKKRDAHARLLLSSFKSIASLRSRRLEVVGERENGRARGRHARGDSLSPRVSPSRARVFSCAHYFQASATQANLLRF